MWVTWNVRGLGRQEKRKVLRHAMDSVKPEIILLQETKLCVGREDVLHGWLRARGLDMVFVSTIQATRGLVLLWRKDRFSSMRVIYGDSLSSCF